MMTFWILSVAWIANSEILQEICRVGQLAERLAASDCKLRLGREMILQFDKAQERRQLSQCAGSRFQKGAQDAALELGVAGAYNGTPKIQFASAARRRCQHSGCHTRGKGSDAAHLFHSCSCTLQSSCTRSESYYNSTLYT